MSNLTAVKDFWHSVSASSKRSERAASSDNVYTYKPLKRATGDHEAIGGWEGAFSFIEKDDGEHAIMRNWADNLVKLDQEDENQIKLARNTTILKHFKYVAFSKLGLWIVDISNANTDEELPLHIGQLPVHIWNGKFYHTLAWCDVSAKHFNVCLWANREASAEDLEQVRIAFPGSIGCHIFVWAFMEVLFPDKRSMLKAKRHADKHNYWHHFGGLPFSLGVAEAMMLTRAEKVAIEWGSTATAGPDERIQIRSSLGVKLKLPSGQERWTTVTHGYVNLIESYPSLVKTAFVRFRDAVTGVRSRENSSSGKKVRIAGTARMVGTIVKSYDEPSASLPYPNGYKHDLSLIAADQGSSLPAMVTGPQLPFLRKDFLPPSKCLDQPCFVAVNQAQQDTPTIEYHEGTASSLVEQDALLVGSQYTWEPKKRGSRRDKTLRPEQFVGALLWRTPHDTDGVQGGSGSVLCAGYKTDEAVNAMVFQNFVKGYGPHRQPLDRASKPADFTQYTFKGGFRLPEEILASEILCERQARTQKSTPSTPEGARNLQQPSTI